MPRVERGHASERQVESPALWQQIRRPGDDAIDAVIGEALSPAEHDDVARAQQDSRFRIAALQAPNVKYGIVTE